MAQYPNPLYALLIFVVAVVGVIFFYRIGKRLRGRRDRRRRFQGRILIEDALKYMYKISIGGGELTLHSIADALGINLDHVSNLIAEMGKRELLTRKNGKLRLTSEGKEYASHIIRSHRLWERYLADQTGLEETEWHVQAEKREHELSPKQANDLSSNLGHPAYDPHGDPIPSSRGIIGRPLGTPLTVLSVGQSVRIVHVEDEPEVVYKQLVAKGLVPGMHLRILEKNSQNIRVWAEGDEHVLSPVLANNLSVVPVSEAEITEWYTRDRLLNLKPGESGRVMSISRACRGDERRRLLDLGLTSGTIVKAEMTGPGGSPTAYLIREAVIALRPEQARMIHIRRIDEKHDSGKIKYRSTRATL